MQHAFLSASKSHQWLACPGSITLSNKIPDVQVPSSYSLEGKKAHKLAQKWLESNKRPKVIDEETKEAIEVYVDHVMFLCALHHVYKPLLEQKVTLPKIGFGTADCIIDAWLDSKLYVIDYKHGQGVSVECENNSQLAYYALGALDKLGSDYDELELVIVQPRCQAGSKIKNWIIKDVSGFISEWQEKFLAAKIAVKLHPEKYISGDHCQFCRGQPICPELHKEAIQLAKIDFNDIQFPKPESLPMIQLLRILEYGDLINSYIKQCRVFALSMLECGKEVPNYKLVKRRSQRKWKDEGTTIKALRKEGLLDNAIFEPTKLKSPAKIEKVIGKDFVSNHSFKADTGNTIAKIDDKREEIEGDFEEV